MQEIKGKVEENPHYMVVEEDRHAQLLVSEEEEKIRIFGSDGTISSPRIPIRESDVIERAISQITQWAKLYNILYSENSESNMSVEFNIKRVEGTRGPTTIGEPEISFNAGEKVRLQVKNTSSKKLYLTILDLSSDGSSKMLYPIAGEEEFLAPDSTPWEEEFETFVPGDLPQVRDMLKLIATEEPVSFGFLEQDPIRGFDDPISANGLKALLADVVMKSRGTKPFVSNVGSWTTRLVVYDIKKPK